MNTTQQRTLTITCTEGNEVTKKQHSCFIHNLIADASKAKPLIQWRRSNSKDGILYCSNGLAEGTLMTLRMLTEKPGVEFTYNRHGKLIYTAVEENGDINCDMHLQHLLNKVTCAVAFSEAAQRRNPFAEMMQSLKPKAPEPEESGTKVGDIFRQITAEQLVAYMFENGPSMVTMGITQGSPIWIQRENMVRSLVAYIQNVPPKNNGFRLVGFGLKRLKDNQMCGLVTTVSLGRIANAEIKFQETTYYTCLKPTEAALKFAADIVSQLVLFD